MSSGKLGAVQGYSGRVSRRDPLSDSGPSITLVCVGMEPHEVSDAVCFASASSVALCIDSIEHLELSRLTTDMFICLQGPVTFGWLKRTMETQVSPRSVPESDIVYGVVYDVRKSEPPLGCPAVAIIVTVYNRPEVAIPCIESIISRTRFPYKELIIMDDSSDDYTFHRLKRLESSLSDQRMRIFSSPRNTGYLTQANMGLSEAFKNCDYAVLVNSDVLVTSGWLTRMVECAEYTNSDLVNPMCNNAAAQSIPFPMQISHSSAYMHGGRSYIDAGFSLSLQSPLYPDAVPSIGQCLLISDRSWTDHGPFSSELYDWGYGEECEFWANVVSAGGKAKIADNAFVYHESHATHGESASQAESKGFNTFLERHEKIYKRSLRRAGGFSGVSLPHRSKIASTGAIGLPVGFVATDIGPWGGVMCVLRIMEGLEELGFDCGLGYLRGSKASSGQKSMSMKFGPHQFRSKRDFKNWEDFFGWREGVVFATHFHSCMYLDMVASETGVTKAAFWQDREDFFRGPDGNLTVDDEFTNNYASIENRIVNARWVGESAKSDLGIRGFSHIPVGVDTDMFYPSMDRRRGGKFRVLSMWRPVTPRRGHERLLRVYRSLRRELGSNVSLEVYGQDESLSLLDGLVDVHHGWMSQRGISDLLRDIDVVLEPSDFQGFGLPGLEAMASGCLLVSTDNRGIHEYGKHGVNCFISNSDDELVEGVTSFLDNPQGAQMMMMSGRRSSLDFDWRRISARWASEILGWDVNWPSRSEEEKKRVMRLIEKSRLEFNERR
tara:strand:+ start:4149 stop:6482 length:2334 start_codon:yes stop_codon:yes gene_type:complete